MERLKRLTNRDTLSCFGKMNLVVKKIKFFSKIAIPILAILLIFVYFYSFKEVKIIPDYDKELNLVAISLDKKYEKYQDLEKTSLPFLINSFPKKTKIFLFSKIKKDEFPEKVKTKILKILNRETNFWVQDSFEVVNKNTVIIPNGEFYVFNSGIYFDDLKYLFKNVIKTPFYFEGGNLFFIKLPNGEKVAIIGQGVILKNLKQKVN